MVRCSVVVTQEFKMEMGMHQELALYPFLFPVVMDRLIDQTTLEHDVCR